MSNQRLHDYLNLDHQTAQRLCAELDPQAEVISLRLIPEGMSTSNYIIELKNSPKKWLLKIYPEGGGNSAIEVASYRWAKQYVNVPEIYRFDDRQTVYHRPYLIMEYIEGTTLTQYIIRQQKFPQKIAFDIGSKLAQLHQREYETMALLNGKLEIETVLLPVSTLHEFYLNGKAGAYLSEKLNNEILEFNAKNQAMLRKLTQRYVYSHGDFSPNNMLINPLEKLWLIDFEYSLTAPIYYDMGKFFRDREQLNPFMNQSVCESFIQGYNSSAKAPAPEDWLKLARWMDITALLQLIDREREKIPQGWIEAIEAEIVRTMRILRNETPF
jgi:thiamine kinase-like enzyme